MKLKSPEQDLESADRVQWVRQAMERYETPLEEWSRHGRLAGVVGAVNGQRAWPRDHNDTEEPGE